MVTQRRPCDARYHEAKRKVFQRMYDEQMTYRGLMEGA